MDRKALMRATAVGTALQLGMVVSGHFIPAVAMLFAPLGMGLSLVAGVLYGRWAAGTRAEAGTRAAAGGALAGGVCAFLGIAVSWGLGDVTAIILAFGTLSSVVAGALGGVLGRRIARVSAAA